jgi:HSP20 family protein
MRIVNWDPFTSFLNLPDRPVKFEPAVKGDQTSWTPPVDIFEQDNNLVIEMELPGVETSAIDLKIENETLILTGERLDKSASKERSRRVSERNFGKFSRKFRLSPELDNSRVAASHVNGVLKITLPVAEAARPRKIEIKAA